MTITKTLVQTKIANYAAERDALLKRADQLALERQNCIDNANTAHGAMLAAEDFLQLLNDAEEQAQFAATDPGESDDREDSPEDDEQGETGDAGTETAETEEGDTTVEL